MIKHFVLSLLALTSIAGATEIKGGTELVILDAKSLLDESTNLDISGSTVARLPEINRLRASNIWFEKVEGIKDELFIFKTNLKGSSKGAKELPAYLNGQMAIPKHMRFGADDVFATMEFLAAHGAIKEISLGYVHDVALYLHSVTLQNDVKLSYTMMKSLRQTHDGKMYVRALLAYLLAPSDTAKVVIRSTEENMWENANNDSEKLEELPEAFRYETYLDQETLEKLIALGTDEDIQKNAGAKGNPVRLNFSTFLGVVPN